MNVLPAVAWFCLLGVAIAGTHSDSRPPVVAHTIYLVRHGAYEQRGDVKPEIGGDLTPLGIAQARLLGSRLRELPVHFDGVTSSTMARAQETAAIIVQSLSNV